MVMSSLYTEKMAAELDGRFVVFLIGMRINKPWKIHKWLPLFLAMPRMLRELHAHPELGFLGHIMRPGIVVQYWRSFDDLEAYARGNQAHLKAWRNFYARIGATSGDVGIWHEAYEIAPGRYEAVYGNMPVHGLGSAGRLVPAAGHRVTARGRLGGVDAARPVEDEPGTSRSASEPGGDTR
jgi:hypothetical protein